MALETKIITKKKKIRKRVKLSWFLFGFPFGNGFALKVLEVPGVYAA